MIGRTLLHYTILDKLGEGGMGIVYKARDNRLHRFVVIKALRPDKLVDADRKRRFVHEAQAASALNHPNIVTVHDICQVEGIDFIVMELVTGEALDMLIEPTGLPLDDAIRWATQVADALQMAHSAGIVHRDLKPGNIMITTNGLAKLLDFGLAKLSESRTDEIDATNTSGPKTMEGAILGTFAYMSPEQALGQHIDGKSDLFSFGAVFHEMLTGSRAFQADSALATLMAVLRDPPRPVRSLNPSIPASVEAVVNRCLEKDVAKRYQHASEIVRDLRKAAKVSSNTIGVPRQGLTQQIATALANMPDLGAGLQTPEELARRIADAVAGRSAPARTAAPLDLLGRFTPESLAEARTQFETAIQTEKDHGPVYAGMSDYYVLQALLGLRDPDDAFRKAQWAARKALELTEEESARVTLALVQAWHEGLWDDARRALEAMRTPHARLRTALWIWRPLAMWREASIELSHIDAQRGRRSAALAWLSLEAHEDASARAQGLASLEEDKTFWLPHWVLAALELRAGDARQAVEVCKSAAASGVGGVWLDCVAAIASAGIGDVQPARQFLARTKWHPPAMRAAVYASIDESDAACRSAEEAIQKRDPSAVSMLRTPPLENLVADPCYRDVLSRFGLRR